MADIGLPKINIIFKALGVSAVSRGQKGIAYLILKDDTDKTFDFAEYTSVADLTSAEIAKFTLGNVQLIRETLAGTPLKLVVARMDLLGVLADLLAKIKKKAPMNCWLGLAEGSTVEQDELVSFVKSSYLNDKKRYKSIVFNATLPDHIQIVNLTNTNISKKTGENISGEQYIARLLGFFAGLELTMSGIAKTFGELESVTEPADLEVSVNNGELVLFNDEGEVRIARAINSLKTVTGEMSDDMKFILVVEVMDLIYSDIHTTWKGLYKGKFKNNSDNQTLLLGAINTYFKTLADENLLDSEFENKATIDLEAQRAANIPKYGASTVATWSDEKVRQMTVGTNVFLKSNIKILNTMEDFTFNIGM